MQADVRVGETARVFGGVHPAAATDESPTTAFTVHAADGAQSAGVEEKRVKNAKIHDKSSTVRTALNGGRPGRRRNVTATAAVP